MKKYFGLITLLFVSVCSYAQTELTPNGLKFSNGDDYMVIECEGKSQTELYNAVNDFLTINYVSPKDVVSSSGTNIISCNGITDIYLNRIAQGRMNYTMVFRFKDGRIRIDLPHINSLYTDGADYELVRSSWLSTAYIFQKNGKLYAEDSKADIENFFNRFISKLQKHISNSSSENW